jgi:hypothetical protein
LEPRQIADPREDGHGGDQINPAHRLQRRHGRGERPLGQRLADRLREAIGPLLRLPLGAEQLLEHNALLALRDLLAGEPAAARPSPGLFARKCRPSRSNQLARLRSCCLLQV